MKKLLSLFIICLCFLACGCSKSNNSPSFMSKIKSKLSQFENKSTFERIKEKGYITVGTKTDAKPFCYKENGEFKGFDIDISKNIAKSILGNENSVKFVEITSETRISKLINEEVDIVVATMSKNSEREQIISFSEPYYVSGQAVMCKKNSQVSSLADLSNHKTAVVVGTTAEKTLMTVYTRTQVQRYKTYVEAYNAVRNTNDTCIIADEPLLKGFAMDNSGYQIFNKKLSTEKYAVAVRQEDEDLKTAINHAIFQMDNSGVLADLTKKWIK